MVHCQPETIEERNQSRKALTGRMIAFQIVTVTLTLHRHIRTIEDDNHPSKALTRPAIPFQITAVTLTLQRHIRMIGSERLLLDLQCPFEKGPGADKVASVTSDHCQVGQAP